MGLFLKQPLTLCEERVPTAFVAKWLARPVEYFLMATLGNHMKSMIFLIFGFPVTPLEFQNVSIFAQHGALSPFPNAWPTVDAQ